MTEELGNFPEEAQTEFRVCLRSLIHDGSDSLLCAFKSRLGALSFHNRYGIGYLIRW